MSVRWAATCVVCVLAILLSSCSSSSTPNNPSPIIGCVSGQVPNCGLFPPGITAGSQNFTLFVAGSGFASRANGNSGDSVAYWNGSARPTTYNINTSQLVVQIFASDVATAGQARVQVINPEPGGGQSNFITFFINAPANGDPVLNSISPTTAASGGAAFTLTANGANFTSTSVVNFNASAKATTFVSATQLTAQVTAADLTTPGCASVFVTPGTPGANGSVSLSVLITGKGAPSDCTTTPTGSAAAFPRVVSVTTKGNASNGESFAPAMSADGRFVAFYSNAKNLVAGAYGNIFVRDTCLGVSGQCKPSTRAVDLAPDGSAPNGVAGDQLAMSADGRFVAFSSYATNLAAAGNAPAANPVAYVYVRDLCAGRDAPAGCTAHTDLASVSPAGEAANASSISPALSGDGRFVAFASWATNLDPAAAEGSQIRVYVRDLCNGATALESCVTKTAAVPAVKETGGTATDMDHPAISADGRYVAFQEWVPRAETTNLNSVVFLRDTCEGMDAPPACTPSTTQISFGADGGALGGINESPSVSGDGRFVTFEWQPATASAGGIEQAIYLRDTCLGKTAPDGCAATTTLIATGAETGLPYSPWISAGGRYISFLVGPTGEDAAAADSPRDGIVYEYDTCFGAGGACAPAARALTAPGSASAAGLLAGDKFTPVPLTADGRIAAFYSASHAAAQPASGLGDIFQALTSH